MLNQIAKEDGPVLGICTGLFTYCTLANVASIMQTLGMIAAGATAIVVFLHRVYVIWKGSQ